MLRVYFLRQWFNLSDPECHPTDEDLSVGTPVEDTLYESLVPRGFVGVDLGRAPAPDETTILRFRHLVEQHDLCGRILDTVNLYLESKGIRIGTGTIVDATIIAAPSLTKNSNGERDPQMHQTRKGRQWYFGAKAHIGVDAKQGHVHSMCTSAASVSDVHMLPDLLHGKEKKVCHPTDDDLSVGTPVWGDGGYRGQTELIHSVAPEAQDMTCRRTQYKDGVDEQARHKNRTQSRVRAKVEWPFRILKRVFGFLPRCAIGA
jgi:IS5 family transposase